MKSYTKAGEPFMSAMTFSKWLNNEFLPENPSYVGLRKVSCSRKTPSSTQRGLQELLPKQERLSRYKKRSDTFLFQNVSALKTGQQNGPTEAASY